MTIDRFPLWVVMSLLGFSPAASAQDEILPPKTAVEMQASVKPESIAAPEALAVFPWVENRDLPLFDFAKIPSVLGNTPKSTAAGSKAGSFQVSANEKEEAKKDREIQHYARLYRIWAFEAFRHDGEEYRRRVTTAQQLLRVWEYEGCDADKRDDLKKWFQDAALASAAGRPLPECDFLNKELLDQIAQGIPFAVSGGNKAGLAFARVMINGSLQWLTPKGMIATAMTMPLPFQLPDPALIVNDEPAVTGDNSTLPANGPANSTTIDQGTTPNIDQPIAGEPADGKKTEPKPLVVDEPAATDVTR